MNKKGWFIVGIGLFLIIIGTIFHFVFSLTEEKKEATERESLIIEKYAPFRSSVETFSAAREKLFASVMNNLFVEEVATSYETWVKEFQSYQNTVDAIEQNSKELKQFCVGQFYDQTDVNNKCEAFIISYETSINYFVKDVEALNTLLDTYQTKVIENEQIPVELWSTNYQFIDLNDDGKYLGKES